MKKAGIGKGMGSRIGRAIEKMDQMALEQMALDEISSSSDESSSSNLNPIFSIFSNLLSLIQKSSLLIDPEINIDDTTGYPKIKNVFKNGNNDKKIQEEKILEEKSLMNAILRPCKKKSSCLLSYVKDSNYAPIIQLVKWCRKQLGDKPSKEEKHGLIRNLHNNAVITDMANLCQEIGTCPDKLTYKWTIGPPGQKFEVCRLCVANAYGFSHNLLDDFASDLKAGYNSHARELGDKSRYIKNRKQAKAAGESQGIELTDEQIRIMLLPNTEAAIGAASWLESYFMFHGDYMPNSEEIHLEPIDRVTIYREYVDDMKRLSEEHLSITKFIFLWKEGFPNVKIREYKAVTGKCCPCAKCCDLRREFTTAYAKGVVGQIHSLHRKTFMSERVAYYERRKYAKNNPDTIMSVITDGFAQTHCLLPWVANQMNYPIQLEQKMLGILEHGSRFVIYRCFENLSDGANFNIYCFLCQLEDWKSNHEGKFPEKIYWQVDGGSENANKYCLATCELLVSNTPIREILFTRLPVGHTHEDIDAKFGNIWKAVRNMNLLSPDAYYRALKHIFSKDKIPFDVKDVFVVPNYKDFLKPQIDSRFQGWTRGDLTQLQWKFQKVKKDYIFPLGVKIEYRSFCSDEVFEIKSTGDIPESKQTSDGKLIGYQIVKTKVSWFPKASPSRPSGMHILQGQPYGPFQADTFVCGSRKRLEKLVESVTYNFKFNAGREFNPSTEWILFADKFAPQTDNVNDFTANHGLHCPLAEYLLGYETTESSQNTVDINRKEKYIACCETGNSVEWSGNPNPDPPRIWVNTPDSELVNQFITDSNLLEGYTSPQLKKMIDLLNKGYPHLKIPKSGNKKEIIERIISANTFIASISSKDKSSSSNQENTVESLCGLKRSREDILSKKDLEKLAKDFNSSQLNAHDPSSSTRPKKISLNGSKSDLIERLKNSGVEISKV